MRELESEDATPPTTEAALLAPPSAGPAVPPLLITGLVVTKADLLAALRLYVPQVTDITALDGERFVLCVAPPTDP
jgi:hypothetical protein